MSRTAELLAALDTYRSARKTLLAAIGTDTSNRDPLAEFAEQLVAALVQGATADNRVQAAWDVIAADGTLIQVKYLANGIRTGAWVNEHRVHRLPGVDWYALVILEDFTVLGVAAFPADLTATCAALGKRHPQQDTQLLLTRRDWERIASDPDQFRALGLRVWLPSDLT